MSTYSYEALPPEHFQMLVQAILVREFPDVQCYPVGMPDGGRDATRALEVYQVKQSRDPRKLSDPYKWLTSSIDGEREKVVELARRGAKTYRLITNISGSSHLDSGLMDRVQIYLNDVMPVPSTCWWASDLDRRLDGYFDLKLRYPALLNGPDIIRAVWEQGHQASESMHRRQTLDTYMRDQYEVDRTVRFKQINLESTELFDLFVDVPMTLAEPHRRGGGYGRRRQAFQPMTSEGSLTEDVVDLEDRVLEQLIEPQRAQGGAELLTSHEVLSRCRFSVVEGAPGQGKTTLSQFLVQLHRARLLDKNADVRKLAKGFANSPVLLPFKMELRDLSLWIRGLDPWSSVEAVPHDEPRTVEGAFAAHIRRHSGGARFSVTDFQAVLRESPSLVILDALDEVADLGDRNSVVAEVLAAIARIDDGHNLHLLVTSRPSAVTGAPVLPRKRFRHFRLAALTPNHAFTYAEKWSSARRLRDRASESVMKTLRARIHAPHMADLAKNTMQLSILLNLIYLYGDDLPDKRTELYDDYVSAFFSREVEKSDIVREHRSLLERIHRYLGYRLHAEAETKRGTGRINESALLEVLTDYLTSVGRPPSLANQLFAGVAERVVALVSRVEGTYEFEVQPLREYFAARHLYETAPYSPPGREASGTKPIRFEGIARNPYWFNVTRFFAGCFSDGELLDLAERVRGVADDAMFKNRSYPKQLALALLQDLVFTQSPHATERVVSLLTTPAGLKWMADPPSPEERRLLPSDAGASLLVSAAWSRMIESSASDEIMGLARLIRRHANAETLLELWRSYPCGRSGVTRIRLARGLGLAGVLTPLDVSEVRSDLTASTDDEWTNTQIVEWAEGGFDDELVIDVASAEWPRSLLDFNRDYWNTYVPNQYISDSHVFRRLTAPGMTSILLWDEGRFLHLEGRSAPERPAFDNWALSKIHEWNGRFFARSGSPYGTSLEPWQALIDDLIDKFGFSWAACEFAAAAAGIRSRAERGKGGSSIVDADAPLTSRARFARSRAKDRKWWEKQLEQISDDEGRMLVLGLAGAWMSSQVLVDLGNLLDAELKLLPRHLQANFIGLAARGMVPRSARAAKSPSLEYDVARLSSLSLPMRCAVLSQAPPGQSAVLADQLLPDWQESPEAATIYGAAVFLRPPKHRALTQEDLALLSRVDRLADIDLLSMFMFHGVPKHSIPPEVADAVLSSPSSYSRSVYRTAAHVADRRTPSSLAVEKRAAREVWFATNVN